MALDIFKSIKALGHKFNALLKTLDNHVEALYEEINSQVTIEQAVGQKVCYHREEYLGG